MSMKILSPAGDFESLKMAVFNGADEVYLGVKDFNSRNIEGFSLQTLKEAVDFAHIFNVKVNLAVNILFNDEEIQSVLDLIVDANNLGVDSFIVQDIGLISLLKKYYPQIEIHASTQMAIHNLEGVKAVEVLGVKRVVLARETSLEEVQRIRKNSNVEIEYFCHGALCVSFSGNCYLSSYLNNASGNRGKCKQLCRLPYSFMFNNKEIKNGYLLSAKDFNMLQHLDKLCSVGVDVLKIEGRARRPYYVGVATKTYKQALIKQNYNLDELKLAFNRDYTAGYIDGNANIISNKQNHIGLNVGKVEKFIKGNKFNEIFISSNKEISPKSVLKFVNGVDEVVITAYDIKKVKTLYRITSTQKVNVGDRVHLISDYEKEQSLLNQKVRRKVKIVIDAQVNKPIKATIFKDNKKLAVLGSVCVQAKTHALTQQELELNFNKSEIFEAELDCKLANVFLPKKELNEFRRNVFLEITKLYKQHNNQLMSKIILKSAKNNKNVKNFDDFVMVFKNFEQFFEKNSNIKENNVIYSPETYNLSNIKNFIKLCLANNKKPILDLPNFATEKDIQLLKEIINKTRIAVIVNNLYALNFETEKIIGGGMNVYNSHSASYYGLPYIKAEGEDYKMPYMTMRHCPMKQHLNADCANCPYKEGFYYKMQNGKTLKLKRKKLTECTFYLTD